MTACLGGTIIDDGEYRYHYFYAGGTLEVTEAGDIDYLVVAGGGGAGGGHGFRGGGGGAGGLLQADAVAVSVDTYTVTVGAGGIGATSGYENGANGGDSQLAGVSALALGGGGGGRGSSTSFDDGAVGGSGGGGGRAGSSPGTGGAGTVGQGYAGADGIGATSNASAGCGGGAGGAALYFGPQEGGPGVTWHDGTTYALGGGLDAGAKAVPAPGGEGEANTGNGGLGGTRSSGLSYDGGSGIVVVRYLNETAVEIAGATLTGSAEMTAEIAASVTRPRSRREQIWLHGLDGTRIGVLR